jgi:hypothetical protein
MLNLKRGSRSGLVPGTISVPSVHDAEATIPGTHPELVVGPTSVHVPLAAFKQAGSPVPSPSPFFLFPWQQFLFATPVFIHMSSTGHILSS